MATIGAAPATQWQDIQERAVSSRTEDRKAIISAQATARAAFDEALPPLPQLMPLRSPSGFSSRVDDVTRPATPGDGRQPWPCPSSGRSCGRLRTGCSRRPAHVSDCGARGGGRLWRPFGPRDVGVCGRACRPRRLATKDGPWLGRSQGSFARKPCT